MQAQLDDLMVFVALARHKRLGPTATRLGVSHTTVSRRVAALERALGRRLFDKSDAGWVLTDDGARLFAEAQLVEAVGEQAFCAVRDPGPGVSGTVRLVTTDGFGVCVVGDLAGRLSARFPGIRVELVTTNGMLPFSARQFDVGITVHPPSLRNVSTVKLTDYRLACYGSPGYLARAGEPRTPEDLADHRWVWFVESLQELPELNFLHPIVANPRIAFQCTTVLGQHAAVAAGAGLGLLPCFLAGDDPRLARVVPGVEVTRTYWMSVPAESSRKAPVRLVADFLLREMTRERPRLMGLPRGLFSRWHCGRHRTVTGRCSPIRACAGCSCPPCPPRRTRAPCRCASCHRRTARAPDRRPG
jgi:DNA-binding transcriptional LysR family regulator